MAGGNLGIVSEYDRIGPARKLKAPSRNGRRLTVGRRRPMALRRSAPIHRDLCCVGLDFQT